MTSPSPTILGSRSEEVAALRQALRATLKPFGPDYWQEVELADRFPDEAFAAMGEAGYFGTLIPESYGGVDAGFALGSVVVEEVNRAGGDAATINAQMQICGALLRGGTDAQKAAILPGVATGETRFLCVAATEPDSGADMRTLESTARRDGDDWVLDAKKVMISLAAHTHFMVVLTRSEAGPTLFMLDLRELGDAVEIRPIQMVTHRMTAMVFLDGLRVPDSARLGEPGQGLRVLMGGFAPRRVFAAAECIGNSRFLLERSLEHARTRRTFDRFIGQNQGVQYPLAQAFAKVEAADALRWDALAAIALGDDANTRSALAKLQASEAAWEMARAALTTFGGWGLAREYHVERKLRESTVFVFNNLLWSMIAHGALELPKAY